MYGVSKQRIIRLTNGDCFQFCECTWGQRENYYAYAYAKEQHNILVTVSMATASKLHFWRASASPLSYNHGNGPSADGVWCLFQKDSDNLSHIHFPLCPHYKIFPTCVFSFFWIAVNCDVKANFCKLNNKSTCHNAMACLSFSFLAFPSNGLIYRDFWQLTTYISIGQPFPAEY